MIFGQQPEHEIEVPYEHRHCCWFCGELSHLSVTIPHRGHLVMDCPHPRLIVPSCKECQLLAYKAKVDCIWQVLNFVKEQLIHRYRKDLAIGLNWTPQELAESEFEGGNFSGFQQSAWFMFEVAKERVNYMSWQLVLHGTEIERIEHKEPFLFDGMQFPSIDEAVKHYCLTFDIKPEYLRQALSQVGKERFAYAVRYCRVLAGATPQEVKAALAIID
ncbi:hypothetical protein [Thalassotalea atypica]|uniref:hypothetical protein n=1 Tax=Thalassotalea atypica TaxID=2054316 RepID=UPI002573E418|nr:hypothetical protein [Thalassotalea atypica]